jgi:hypothetical protein
MTGIIDKARRADFDPASSPNPACAAGLGRCFGAHRRGQSERHCPTRSSRWPAARSRPPRELPRLGSGPRRTDWCASHGLPARPEDVAAFTAAQRYVLAGSDAKPPGHQHAEASSRRLMPGCTAWRKGQSWSGRGDPRGIGSQPGAASKGDRRGRVFMSAFPMALSAGRRSIPGPSRALSRHLGRRAASIRLV